MSTTPGTNTVLDFGVAAGEGAGKGAGPASGFGFGAAAGEDPCPPPPHPANAAAAATSKTNCRKEALAGIARLYMTHARLHVPVTPASGS
jgi:hypothetical protein